MYHLRAMDEIGGQAIYEHGGRWFRIAFDDDWLPVELKNRADAIRCTLVAPYENRNESFPDANTLIESVAAKWNRLFDVEDVPLSEVVHLFPTELRRAWRTAQQRQHAREAWNECQSHWRRMEDEAQHGKRYSRPSRPLCWPSSAFRPEARTADIWATTARCMFQLAEKFWPQIQPTDMDDLVAVASAKMTWRLQKDKSLFEKLQKDERQFRDFAKSVLRWTWSDACRQSQRFPGFVSLDDAPDEVLNVREPQPSRAAHLTEIREVIGRAIADLPTREASLVREYCATWPRFGFSTIHYLAEEMDIPVNVARRLLSHALRHLKRRLAQAGFGPEDC